MSDVRITLNVTFCFDIFYLFCFILFAALLFYVSDYKLYSLLFKKNSSKSKYFLLQNLKICLFLHTSRFFTYSYILTFTLNVSKKNYNNLNDDKIQSSLSFAGRFIKITRNSFVYWKRWMPPLWWLPFLLGRSDLTYPWSPVSKLPHATPLPSVSSPLPK